MPKKERRTILDALYDKIVDAIDGLDVSDVDLSRLLAMGGPKNDKVVDAEFEDLPAKAPRKRRKAAPALPAPEDVSQPSDREK